MEVLARCSQAPGEVFCDLAKQGQSQLSLEVGDLDR